LCAVSVLHLFQASALNFVCWFILPHKNQIFWEV